MLTGRITTPLPPFFVYQAGGLLEESDAIFVENAYRFVRMNLAMLKIYYRESSGMNAGHDSAEKINSTRLIRAQTMLPKSEYLKSIFIV